MCTLREYSGHFCIKMSYFAIIKSSIGSYLKMRVCFSVSGNKLYKPFSIHSSNICLFPQREQSASISVLVKNKCSVSLGNLRAILVKLKERFSMRNYQIDWNHVIKYFLDHLVWINWNFCRYWNFCLQKTVYDFHNARKDSLFWIHCQSKFSTR